MDNDNYPPACTTFCTKPDEKQKIKYKISVPANVCDFIE